MDLWLISQFDAHGWDTYDSAVVVAETAEDAKRIHPDGRTQKWETESYRSWASRPELVTAQSIGTADPELEAGTVICASFNAG